MIAIPSLSSDTAAVPAVTGPAAVTGGFDVQLQAELAGAVADPLASGGHDLAPLAPQLPANIPPNDPGAISDGQPAAVAATACRDGIDPAPAIGLPTPGETCADVLAARQAMPPPDHAPQVEGKPPVADPASTAPPHGGQSETAGDPVQDTQVVPMTAPMPMGDALASTPVVPPVVPGQTADAPAHDVRGPAAGRAAELPATRPTRSAAGAEGSGRTGPMDTLPTRSAHADLPPFAAGNPASARAVASAPDQMTDMAQAGLPKPAHDRLPGVTSVSPLETAPVQVAIRAPARSPVAHANGLDEPAGRSTAAAARPFDTPPPATAPAVTDRVTKAPLPTASVQPGNLPLVGMTTATAQPKASEPALFRPTQASLTPAAQQSDPAPAPQTMAPVQGPFPAAPAASTETGAPPPPREPNAEPGGPMTTFGAAMTDGGRSLAALSAAAPARATVVPSADTQPTPAIQTASPDAELAKVTRSRPALAGAGTGAAPFPPANDRPPAVQTNSGAVDRVATVAAQRIPQRYDVPGLVPDMTDVRTLSRPADQATAPGPAIPGNTVQPAPGPATQGETAAVTLPGGVRQPTASPAPAGAVPAARAPEFPAQPVLPDGRAEARASPQATRPDPYLALTARPIGATLRTAPTVVVQTAPDLRGSAPLASAQPEPAPPTVPAPTRGALHLAPVPSSPDLPPVPGPSPLTVQPPKSDLPTAARAPAAAIPVHETQSPDLPLKAPPAEDGATVRRADARHHTPRLANTPAAAMMPATPEPATATAPSPPAGPFDTPAAFRPAVSAPETNVPRGDLAAAWVRTGDRPAAPELAHPAASAADTREPMGQVRPLAGPATATDPPNGASARPADAPIVRTAGDHHAAEARPQTFSLSQSRADALSGQTQTPATEPARALPRRLSDIVTVSRAYARHDDRTAGALEPGATASAPPRRSVGPPAPDRVPVPVGAVPDAPRAGPDAAIPRLPPAAAAIPDRVPLPPPGGPLPAPAPLALMDRGSFRPPDSTSQPPALDAGVAPDSPAPVTTMIPTGPMGPDPAQVPPDGRVTEQAATSQSTPLHAAIELVLERAERAVTDSRSAGMSLSLDTLGSVSVSVSVSGDTAHVAFEAASAETRRLLVGAEPRLSADLSTIGLVLADRHGGTDGSGARHHGPPSTAAPPGTAASERPPDTPAPADPPRSRHVNLIA